MSWPRRSEYHRSVTFMGDLPSHLRSSLVDELLGSGEEPRESVTETVAPVLPVVAVARLRVAHRHASVAEDRDHRPVRGDERLVDAARHEETVDDRRRLLAEAVDELHDRVEGRAAAVVEADVGEDERGGLEHERAEEAGVAHRRRQRRDAAEGAAHEAARLRGVDEGESLGEQRHELARDEPGVRRVVGVLLEPVPGRHEDRDERVDVEPVDEVVEDGLHRRELEVVGAVVHDEQRVALRPVEAGRQVDLHRLVTPQGLAAELLLDEGAGAGLRVEGDPLGHAVADRRAHRRGPHRAVGQTGVERVVETLVVLPLADLDLVLDPGALGQHGRHGPEVGPPDPLERQRVRQTDDTVPHPHLVDVAAEEEGRPLALDDRAAVALEEAVDHRPVQRHPIAQQVDGETFHGAHAAPTTDTWPVRSMTRAPDGRSVTPSGTRTTAPSSSSSSRCSPKRLARTDIRSWSSSCRRRLACGSAMTPGSRPSPVSCTSAAVTPCGVKSWKSTTSSVSAIAPADHATTVCSRRIDTSKKRSVQSRVRTFPPAMTTASHSSRIAPISPWCHPTVPFSSDAARARVERYSSASCSAYHRSTSRTASIAASSAMGPTPCSDVRWLTACTASIAACSRMP